MNKIDRIMFRKYILLAFGFFMFFSYEASAQLKLAGRDTTFNFTCENLRPIDLYKAMNVQISPSVGYWGDENKVPLESNIFDPRTIFNKIPGTIIDTFSFYFYFTKIPNGGYCDFEVGDDLKLTIYLNRAACETVDGIRDNFSFCYNDFIEQFFKKDISELFKKYSDAKNGNAQMAALLFGTSDEPDKWENAKIAIYPTAESTVPISDWKLDVDKINGEIDSLFVEISLEESSGYTLDRKKIIIIHNPQSVLNFSYTPDVTSILTKIDIDAIIKLEVENQDLFESFKYYLNNKYLNERYLPGADTTKGEIDLEALLFSGSEDIIEVIVRDTNQCLVSKKDNIVVNVPMLNTFTPDGDGINDVFYGGEKYRNREFYLQVFNRWGNRLYEGHKGWDGKSRGYDVPPGTYLYTIEIKRSDGTSALVKGYVTLIRERSK